jgi:hypothetical protein
MALREACVNTPGLYNRYEVEKLFAKALRVQDIEKILPDPKGPNAVPPPQNPKIQIEQMKIEADKAQQEVDTKLGLMQMMKEAELTQAKIAKMEAEIKLLEVEAGGAAHQMQINELNSQIALAKERREGIVDSVKMMKDMYDATTAKQEKEEKEKEAKAKAAKPK